MKTGEDFRREFPEMTESFERAAQRALHELQDEKKQRKMKFRPMLAFAAVLVLLMSVGVAATWERWSLDDFIAPGRITATEDEWQQMIDAFEPVTVQATVAEVTVREALFDGYALYLAVDVVPKHTSDFFMPTMVELDAKAREAADSLPGDMTVREYVALHGYDRVFKVGLHPAAKGITFLPEMQLNEDGSMTFYLRQRMQQRAIQHARLETKLTVVFQPAGGSGTNSVSLPLTLECLPVKETAISPSGVSYAFPNSGVSLTNFCLTRTLLSTYVTADVEITDPAAYEARFGSYTFNFYGIDGGEFDAGPFNMSGFMQEPVGSKGELGAPYYMATLTMSELPDAFMLCEKPWGVMGAENATAFWMIQLEKAE